MNALARMALSLSSFVLVGAVLMLFFVTPGTGEFVISCVAVAIGLIALAASVLMARWSIQRPQFRGGNE